MPETARGIYYPSEEVTPDVPADMKKAAESISADLEKTDHQPLSWLKSGTKGQLIVCNSSGVPQYVTAKGDATVAEDGTLTIASVSDTKLTSPNNATYRTLCNIQTLLNKEKGAGTYFIRSGGDALTAVTVGTAQAPVWFMEFAKADYEVTGKTQKLRLRAQIGVGGTAATITYTAGLYPLSVSGGGYSAGTVVSGSTVAIANPTSNSIAASNSGDFTIPANGIYALAVVFSGTSNVPADLSIQLQTRSV
jgi:hypothetical protein